MLITVISTYPENGSKNVGDLLLTAKTIEFLQRLHQRKAADIAIRKLWREDQSQEAVELIDNSDLIVFACLAIRPRMKSIYPLIENIIASKAVVAVLASGTSLPVEDEGDTLRRQRIGNSIFDFDRHDIRILKDLQGKSVAFSTRDVFTQEVLCEHDIPALHTGDIAFIGSLNNYPDCNQVACFPSPERPVIISDPHYPLSFIEAFSFVVQSMVRDYGKESVVIALHGVNPVIADFASSQGIRVDAVYQKGIAGLDIYQEALFHFGFRVHAHVSALAKGKPSYLLEIDGRGSSYGMTIPISCSRPCYRPAASTRAPSLFLRAARKVKRSARGLFTCGTSQGVRLSSSRHPQASLSPVQQLMAMANSDKFENFSRFNQFREYLAGLERKYDAVLEQIDKGMVEFR